MADLKDLYSPDFIQQLGIALQQQSPNFDTNRLLADCLTADWPDLKLMERRDRITVALHQQLPADFTRAAPLLRAIGPEFTGLVAVCLPNYVATYGLDHWQTSMDLLAWLTRFSSAEFAIRPFLVRYPATTAQQMLTWSTAENVDVRRLASEGIRPRLPWGLRLTQYVADPTPIFAILNNLITDESDYVQKSVANNLNDISKDHPDQVLAFAQTNWDRTSQTNWMLTRGLRTLFKQGNPLALQLQGYDPAAVERLDQVQLSPATQDVTLGDTSRLRYALRSTGDDDQPLSLGYRVHYVRQNKTDAYKDFFLKRATVAPGEGLTGEFKITWRQLTTRRLYAGQHPVELLVNTRPVAQATILLAIPDPA